MEEIKDEEVEQIQEVTFDEFGFEQRILEGLDAMGFSKPTPIQQQAVPVIMKGQDIIACAQTGTGKTAAYLLPAIHQIISKGTDHSHVHTMIIAPTRELALQIDQQVEGFAYFAPVSSIAVYGGGDGSTFDQQKKALTTGADIIIATPGRLMAHLNMGYVDLSHLKLLILDEADKMLDMGFFEDIMKINGYLPKQKQTLMFSATMPPKIRQMAGALLKDPHQVNIALAKPAAGILQAAYMVYDNQKIELTKQLLLGKDIPSVIVFSSRKSSVKDLEKELRRNGFTAASIHSDLEQKEREEVLRAFKSRKIQILVATDILSRGIDIENINLVINYDVPNDAEDYVHRIGRTARAEKTGVAITYITEKDQKYFQRIEQLIEREIPKSPLPPSMGEGPAYNPDSKSNYRERPGGRSGFKRGGKSFSNKNKRR